MRTAEEIRAALRAINPEWAKGEAMFGDAGVNGLTLWDCHRKVNLSVIEIEARATIEAGGGKPTEKMIESMAHAAPSYQTFVREGLEARRGWIELNAERELLLMELRTAESHESFGVGVQ